MRLEPMRVPARRRSRIAQFKAPFIVSVAGPAALGIACGGQAGTAADTADTAQAPGDRSALARADAGVLPPQLPITALACKGAAPVDPSPCHADPVCEKGEWVLHSVSCNPPNLFRPCPASEPALGASCAGYPADTSCEYEYCSGTQPTRRCNGSQLWEQVPLPTCNPPAMIRACPLTMPVPGSDCPQDG